MKTILKTAFKGHRHYVHGTDMFNESEAACRSEFGLNSWLVALTVREMASNACELTVGQEPDQQLLKVADLLLECPDGSRVRGELRETSNEIVGRRDYDEDAIVRLSEIHGEDCRQLAKTSFTPIEEVIALTKGLHNAVFPPADGQWVFGRIVLNQPFEGVKDELFEISVKNNRQGVTTVSEVRTESCELGRIYFGVVQ